MKSFGVSGVLSEKADVFYSTTFSTRYIGAISDLLSARMKKSGLNELKLRALLLLSSFQGYRGQFKKRRGIQLFSRGDLDLLDHPIFLECGIDQEKIAIGVCFVLKESLNLNSEGISERILANTPQDPFEEMLVGLHYYADRIILKFQSDTRKAEVIALMAIEGKIASLPGQSQEPLEFVLLNRDHLESTPQPRAYYNLGDLDYNKALKKDHKEMSIEISSTGDFLMPSDHFESEEEIPLEVEIPQVTTETQEEIHLDLQSEEVIPEVHPVPILEPTHFGIKSFWNRFKDRIRNFLDQFFNTPEPLMEVIETAEVVEQEMEDLQLSEESIESESVIEDSGNAGHIINRLMMDLRVGAINQLLLRSSQELKEIRKGIRNPKIIHWIEGILKTVHSERSHLHSLAKGLERIIRFNEKNSKEKLLALHEEIKHKESQITVKTQALARTREHLVEITGNVERLKIASQASALDANYKKQFEMTQKMLISVKNENNQLKKSLAEKNGDPVVSQNEVDEPLEKSMSAINSGEMRKSLDGALKLVKDYKKEAEIMKARCVTLQKREVKMKIELTQLKEALEKKAL